MHIADRSDDRDPRSLVVCSTEPNTSIQRGSSAKIALRKRLVDDGNERRRRRISSVEDAPFVERDVHRGKISGRRHSQGGVWLLARGGKRSPFNDEAHAAVV